MDKAPTVGELLGQSAFYQGIKQVRGTGDTCQFAGGEPLVGLNAWPEQCGQLKGGRGVLVLLVGQLSYAVRPHLMEIVRERDFNLCREIKTCGG